MLNRPDRVLVTNTESANTGTSLPTIINGDMLIFNEAFTTALTGTGGTITSSANNSRIYIAQGIAAGRAIVSMPIVLKNVTKVTVRGYSAPAEKVMTYGYNGTSGTISTPDDSTEYQLTILVKDDQRIQGNRPTTQKYNYKTSSSATAKELAFAFAQKVENDCIAGNTNSYVTAVVLTNGTFSALSNDATVTQFGKTITSTAHGLSAGNYVRIGGTGGTAPVYEVDTIIDADTFTIKGRYMGSSGTVLAANIGTITSDTSVGLQLTARAIAYNGVDLYQKVNFTTSLANVNGAGFDVLTAPVVTTEMAMGQGYWQQVRDAEYFAQGYLGITNRIQFPGSIQNPSTRAVVDNTYNSVTIEHYSEEETHLQQLAKKPLTTSVYFYSSSAPSSSTKQTAFLNTLEALIESAGVFVK